MITIKSAEIEIKDFKSAIQKSIENNIVDSSTRGNWRQPVDLEWDYLGLKIILDSWVHFEKEDENGKEMKTSKYIISTCLLLPQKEGDHEDLTLWTSDGSPIEITNLKECLDLVEGIIENTRL